MTNEQTEAWARVASDLWALNGDVLEAIDRTKQRICLLRLCICSPRCHAIARALDDVIASDPGLLVHRLIRPVRDVVGVLPQLQELLTEALDTGEAFDVIVEPACLRVSVMQLMGEIPFKPVRYHQTIILRPSFFPSTWQEAGQQAPEANTPAPE